MPSLNAVDSPVEVVAENVGGIDSTDVTLRPGVNVLSGRNATNRTSFLQAIMAALGSRRPSLKGDAEEGRVELTFDGERYTRTLTRRDETVAFDGDPYLDDPELADLFAFLLESNEARRAVRRGDDLRELIMRPIDTDEIQAEITMLEAEKRDVDERLADLEGLEEELPALEERRTAVEADLAEREERLDELEAALERADADVERSRRAKRELEETFADLRGAREALEDVEFDLETERESRDELERERERLRDELEGTDADEPESPERLEGRVRELRERKRSLESTLNELRSVIRFNEDQLADGGPDFGETLDQGGDGDVTDRLVADADETVCWTCGSTVRRERIETTLDRLQDLHQEKLAERNDLQERIDELARRQAEIEERTERIERLRTRLADVETELAEREKRIEELEAEREEREERVEELEAQTDSFERADYGEVLDLHREANRLELEIGDLEDEREEIEDRIEEIETRLDERSDLEDRREGIREELTELRTRVDRIEADAVEAFNDHMESILAILEYENIDRIWIERHETTVREGRRTTSRSAFDLHVVRTADDGTTYEDRVEHLSESEREVTGLVFALAGYLVHEVHEVVPFMLLDSLEAIDADRIAALVEYFESYADCLVVALLHEDAQALPDSYAYVTDI
ncbi:archaea-specific SMC-related protein [Salinilacihabitans rarus]|uniref:archaea-specific SMC-related protein n=1 Tax=Salinilacihabitans rarus TaxID=2961596 RepID=UPI0020C8A572|nr:archaea-specific SMC-related protein [Salinilacihabitans rarus]